MSSPILVTKLYIPPPRAKFVLRPRLVERLNEGLLAGHKLTLISAPAGCAARCVMPCVLQAQASPTHSLPGKLPWKRAAIHR